MGAFQRLAIYWTPEPGSDLATFANAWFKTEDATGSGGQFDRLGLAGDLHGRAIKDPARYCLHATLKAPFRLADGKSVHDLQESMQSFCNHRRAVTVGPLILTRYHTFLALVPRAPVAAVEWLADQCVSHFDRFRAPLNEDDRKRRKLGGDYIEQRRLFEEFGYPYVFSAFRFHVTLAGPLDELDIGVVEDALRHTARAFNRPFRVESLTLMGEPPGGGQFEVISRHALMR